MPQAAGDFDDVLAGRGFRPDRVIPLGVDRFGRARLPMTMKSVHVDRLGPRCSKPPMGRATGV
jgi:hypothetical protein